MGSTFVGRKVGVAVDMPRPRLQDRGGSRPRGPMIHGSK